MPSRLTRNLKAISSPEGNGHRCADRGNKNAILLLHVCGDGAELEGGLIAGSLADIGHSPDGSVKEVHISELERVDRQVDGPRGPRGRHDANARDD